MKTEDFDDAFKRKIESVYQPFNEKDIDALHNYVSKKETSISSGNRIAVISLLSLLLLITAGLLTWNFVQLNENKLLEQKNIALQTALTKTDSLLNAQKNYSSGKNDTVYVTKYINSEDGNKLEERASNLATGYSPIETTVKNSNKNPSTVNSIVYNSDKKSNGKTEKQYKKLSSGQNSKNDATEYSVENGKNNLTDEQKDILSIKKDTLSVINTETEKPDLSIVTNSGTEKSVLADTETTDEPVNEKKYFLKNLNYNVGIGSEIANSQFAFSLLGEILFNKRWSITLGAKYLKVYNEKYHDEDDFRHRNGKNFKDLYSPNSPDTSMASDIDLKYTIIQIPFAVNYTLPLKNKFSILFSCGTDIDLYAKKYIRYDYRTPNTPRVHRSSDTKDPILMFNNAVLAIGIQKQWGRFPIQLSPFISPQFSSVDYKKESWYYGVRLRVLYRIGK